VLEALKDGKVRMTCSAWEACAVLVDCGCAMGSPAVRHPSRLSLLALAMSGRSRRSARSDWDISRKTCVGLKRQPVAVPGPQALADFIRTAAFRERAAELKGYDVAATGSVRHIN
jgi:hypothetical protein